MSIVRIYPMITHNKRFLTRIQKTKTSVQFYITPYGYEADRISGYRSETQTTRTEMGRVSTW